MICVCIADSNTCSEGEVEGVLSGKVHPESDLVCFRQLSLQRTVKH